MRELLLLLRFLLSLLFLLFLHSPAVSLLLPLPEQSRLLRLLHLLPPRWLRLPRRVLSQPLGLRPWRASLISFSWIPRST